MVHHNCRGDVEIIALSCAALAEQTTHPLYLACANISRIHFAFYRNHHDARLYWRSPKGKSIYSTVANKVFTVHEPICMPISMNAFHAALITSIHLGLTQFNRPSSHCCSDIFFPEWYWYGHHIVEVVDYLTGPLCLNHVVGSCVASRI